MAFMSAEAHFDGINHQIQLLRRYEGELPQVFVDLYKRIVVDLTPKDSSALRRSITTHVLGNRAEVSWRSEYAAAQNLGSFTARRTYVANISRDGNRKGPYIKIHAGQTYNFNVYPKGGGKNFATIAFQRTLAAMEPELRHRGLIQ